MSVLCSYFDKRRRRVEDFLDGLSGASVDDALNDIKSIVLACIMQDRVVLGPDSLERKRVAIECIKCTREIAPFQRFR